MPRLRADELEMGNGLERGGHTWDEGVPGSCWAPPASLPLAPGARLPGRAGNSSWCMENGSCPLCSCMLAYSSAPKGLPAPVWPAAGALLVVALPLGRFCRCWEAPRTGFSRPSGRCVTPPRPPPSAGKSAALNASWSCASCVSACVRGCHKHAWRGVVCSRQGAGLLCKMLVRRLLRDLT